MGIVIRTFLELAYVTLLIVGLFHEKEIIEFEDTIVWFYKECKKRGYNKRYFFVNLMRGIFEKEW